MDYSFLAVCSALPYFYFEPKFQPFEAGNRKYDCWKFYFSGTVHKKNGKMSVEDAISFQIS